MSRWTERQHALLAELGVVGWWADPPSSQVLPSEPPELPPEPLRVPQQTSVPEPKPARRPPLSSVPPAPPAEMPVASTSPVVTGAVASMDWAELRAAVQGCRACGLCEKRTQTVFGVGHPQAHWMIVGEAPGEQEDAQGEPFVGKAGQLLDRMLASAGLTRQDVAGADAAEQAARQVYIANVLKCRPPGNRNPEPQEVLRCEPYLRRQIDLVQPKLILAMGRFAVQTLLGSQEAIGRLRGRVHRPAGLPPVIVTYHPAYLLRNPVDKSKAWDDLCLAARTLHAVEASS
jgi:uracil-DNA glycosylase